MWIKTLKTAVPFIWFGMVLAISFLEAPLKFQAPGITIPLGLGIGQLVFFALNKIEIVCGLLLLVAYWRSLEPEGRDDLTWRRDANLDSRNCLAASGARCESQRSHCRDSIAVLKDALRVYRIRRVEINSAVVLGNRLDAKLFAWPRVDSCLNTVRPR